MRSGNKHSNKPSASNKSDSTSSYDKTKTASVAKTKLQKQRRHIKEDDHNYNRDSASPSSPDQTYETSDREENGDHEQEWDME